MSKPVKELVRKELVRRFDGVTSMAVVGFTGVDANATVEIRKRLDAKGICVTVVKNSLARQAFKIVGLDAAVGLLDGPCAVATGGDSVVDVVRELLDISKTHPNLTVKAAVLEGDAFGADRMLELSKFPTRDEAIARVVGCALAPGAKVAGCLIGPGGAIASILETIQDNQGGADAAPPAEAGGAGDEAGASSSTDAAETPEAPVAPAEADAGDEAGAAAPPAEASGAGDEAGASSGTDAAEAPAEAPAAEAPQTAEAPQEPKE